MPSSIFKSLMKRKRKSSGCLGLEFVPEGIAWAERVGDAPPQANGFEVCPPAGRAACLQSLVAARGWQGRSVHLVLPLDQYQVFQVDRPEVAAEEVVDAVRWKLKDLLDYSAADAVIDIFDFPADASRGRTNLINAVCAEKNMARTLVQLITDAQMTLERIDIAELALRNLAALLSPAENRATALVVLRQQQGHMVFCKGGVLYLSRRVDVSLSSLGDVQQQENAVQSLALEIQRSMDYFESQLAQVPPRQLFLIAEDTRLPLAQMLGANIAPQVLDVDWSGLALQLTDPRALQALLVLLDTGEDA